MRRVLRFAMLSLLLLSMQWQGHVHPIEHFVRVGHHAQDTVLSTSQAGVDCVECALLAGGFNAVHVQAVSAPPAVAAVGVAPRRVQFRPADVPAWFRSRAPPVLV
jgi:hypothetical protein